jgi:hypothetical protein
LAVFSPTPGTQGEDIHDPRGRDAEDFFDARGVENAALFRRVQDHHALADELVKVLVRSHENDSISLLATLARQRRQHVVGFETGSGQHRPAHQPRGFLRQGELRDERGGRRRPVGFVLGEDLVAVRRPLEVERDAQVVRLVLADQLAHRGEETEHRVGRRSVRRGQR